MGIEGDGMKVGKREKGKIYLYRNNSYRHYVDIYLGKKRKPEILYFCYTGFSRFTGIKLKPGQMIEIEVRAKGGVG